MQISAARRSRSSVGRGQEFAGAVKLLGLHAGSRSLLAASDSEAKLLRTGGSR